MSCMVDENRVFGGSFIAFQGFQKHSVNQQFNINWGRAWSSIVFGVSNISLSPNGFSFCYATGWVFCQ